MRATRRPPAPHICWPRGTTCNGGSGGAGPPRRTVLRLLAGSGWTGRGPVPPVGGHSSAASVVRIFRSPWDGRMVFIRNPIFMVHLHRAGTRSAALATDPRHEGEIKGAVRGGGTAARRELEGRHRRSGDRAVRDRPDVDAGIGGNPRSRRAAGRPGPICGPRPVAISWRVRRDVVSEALELRLPASAASGGPPPSSSIRPSSEVAPMSVKCAVRLGVTRVKGPNWVCNACPSFNPGPSRTIILTT